MTTPHLWILDGYGFVYRAFHALPPLKRKDGMPVGAVYGFTNMLLRILEEQQPTHILVVFDEGGKNHRHTLYPEYKAHRPPAPDDLVLQFPLVREVTAALQLPSLETKGAEADDIIATLVAKYKDTLPITILSSDKDLMQLVGGQVDMLDPVKLKRIDTNAVLERFGVPPTQVLDVLALMGDSADNIPGVPGIGPKTATELIQRFGSIEALYASINELTPSKRKENLLEFKHDAFLSKQLAALNYEVVLEAELANWQSKPLNHPQLAAFLGKMEFHSLQKKFASKPETPAPAPATATMQISAAADLGQLTSWCKQAEMAEAMVLLPAYSEGMLSTLSCYYPGGALIELVFGSADPSIVQGSLFAAPSSGISLTQALQCLQPLFGERSLLKIIHDCKGFLKHCFNAAPNLVITPLADLMLMAYLLASQQRFESPMEVVEHFLPGDNQPLHLQYIELATLLKQKLLASNILTLYEQIERPLIAVLAAMEWRGITLDSNYLRTLARDFEQQLNALEINIYKEAGCEFNIGSSKQLGEILVNKMGLPLYKKTAKSKAIDTSAEVLDELAAQGHLIAQLLLKWRALAKLQSTYTEALIKQINPRTGRVHTTFAMTATNTGRLSSQNPNLQNIPIRSPEGQKIRQAFVAAPGKLLVMADYSQIELRVLAQLAGIEALQDAFKHGVDVHSLTASQVFAVPLAEVDSNLRRKAKTVNFGIIYGISAFGLANRMNIPRQEAASIIARYFATYPGIERYMQEQKTLAHAQGFVRTQFGRICALPMIHASNQALRSNAERAAINAPIQGTAADIMKKAMLACQLALSAHDYDAHILLQIHDELVVETPANHAEKVAALVKQAMEQAVTYPVPLLTEVAIGRHLGEKG